jgi:hypothetical protein
MVLKVAAAVAAAEIAHLDPYSAYAMAITITTKGISAFIMEVNKLPF